MRKINFIALTFLIGIMAFTACSRDDDGEIVLDIGTPLLSFDKTGGEKDVKITVKNSDAFWASVQEGTAWVSLVQGKNGLTVKAMPNMSGNDRSCKIRVTTGKFELTKEIKVEQKGDVPKLLILPDSVKFDQFGGQTEVHIETNMSGIKIEGIVPKWATFVVKEKNKEIKIKVEKNDTCKSRDAKIKISSGNTSAFLKLHQEGSLYFILPYLDFNGSLRDVMIFENERKSIYEHDYNEDVDCFYTISPVFYEIVYSFENNVLKGIAVYTKLENKKPNQNFVDWLKSQGYSEVKNSQGQKWHSGNIEISFDSDQVDHLIMIFTYNKKYKELKYNINSSSSSFFPYRQR